MKIIKQSFNWHDATNQCRFHYGKYQNLEIDGSHTGIRCSRQIRSHHFNSESSLELNLSVLIGKDYGIRIYNSHQEIIVDVVISRKGWILNRSQDGLNSTGLFLAHGGLPVVDSEFYPHHWYHWYSDYFTLKFTNFCHKNKSFSLHHSQKSYEFTHLDIELPESSSISVKNKNIVLGLYQINQTSPVDIHPEIMEIYSESKESGTVVRLKHYKHSHNDSLIEQETYPIYWKPCKPVPDGYAQDNACEVVTRPINYNWLETQSWYGWVTAKIPKIFEGSIELLMSASDVGVESVLQLGSYTDNCLHKSSLDITVGILENKFKLSWNSLGNPMAFQRSSVTSQTYLVNPHRRWLSIKEQISNHQIFKVKLSWSTARKIFEIVVDDQIVYDFQGSQNFNLSPNFFGIDAISLHPGWAGARMTMSEKKKGSPLFPRHSYKQPQRGYWKDIVVKDYSFPVIFF
jgi:hypothetical protein